MTQDKNGFSSQYRAPFILGILGIAVLSGVAIYWVLRADYAELRTFESTQVASLVAQELEKNGIDYRFNNDGLSLSVNSKGVDVANSILSSLDIQHIDTVGLEIFETSDFGITDFAQKVNYKRAMEGELTRTISSLKEVRHARVHLVMAEKNLLVNNDSRSTASIVVFLEGNSKLNWAQVAGIQDLVSKTIPSLSRDDVTVTDQNGIILSSNEESMFSANSGNLRTSLESRMEQQLRSVIQMRFPDAPISVTVNLSLSSESLKRVSERPVSLANSEGAVVSSREVKETGSDGVESVSTEKTYQYGLVQETYESKPGQISRISAAIYIGEDLTAQQKADLQNFAGAAIGVDASRGDSLVIMAEPTLAETSAENTSLTVNTERVGDGAKENFAQASYPSQNTSDSEQPFWEAALNQTSNETFRYLLFSTLALFLAAVLLFILYVKERKKDRLSKKDLRKVLHLVNTTLNDELSGS